VTLGLPSMYRAAILLSQVLGTRPEKRQSESATVTLSPGGSCSMSETLPCQEEGSQ